MRVPLWTVGKEKTIKTILRDALLERGQVSKVVTVHGHEAFWFENKRGRRRTFMENLLRRELGRPMTPGTPEWWFDESGTNGGGEEEEVSDGVSTPRRTPCRFRISMTCPVGRRPRRRAALSWRRWIRFAAECVETAREAGAATGAGGERGEMWTLVAWRPRRGTSRR